MSLRSISICLACCPISLPPSRFPSLCLASGQTRIWTPPTPPQSGGLLAPQPYREQASLLGSSFSKQAASSTLILMTSVQAATVFTGLLAD